MSKDILGIRKAQERNPFPAIDLFPQVEYNGRKIDASVFGENTYLNNVSNMGNRYFHSNNLSNVTFKPLTTAESIAVASHDFANLAKPMIFDPRWLQAGYIIRTSQGVFANPPRDSDGFLIINEEKLTSLLNGIKPIKVEKGNVYLGNNDFGFAENDSFQRGFQDCDTFVKGGLAKILEHTPEQVAKNLKTIADKRNYPGRVNVRTFDIIEKPTLSVIGLSSYTSLGEVRLYVYGDLSDAGHGKGFAFGGLVSGEVGAKKID